VRSTIHSSLVSTIVAISALLTARLGSADPVPVTTERNCDIFICFL
jgi:hypothetical protein